MSSFQRGLKYAAIACSGVMALSILLALHDGAKGSRSPLVPIASVIASVAWLWSVVASFKDEGVKGAGLAIVGGWIGSLLGFVVIPGFAILVMALFGLGSSHGRSGGAKPFGFLGGAGRVGSNRIAYDQDGRPCQIGNRRITYDQAGKATHVGDQQIVYGVNGRASYVGDERVLIGQDGKILQVGERRIFLR